MPGREIQRRAPLISVPATRVSAVSARAPAAPSSARRSVQRGESSETQTITTTARPEYITCRDRNMRRDDAPMRSATAGLALSIMT